MRILSSLIIIFYSSMLVTNAYPSERLLAQKYIQEHLATVQTSLIKKTLPNGLTVLLFPLPNTYKVYVGITYNVGSKNEAIPQEYGFAHAIEHMIFKGTSTLSETDIKALAEKFGVASIGEGFNAFTSQDMTHYYFLSDKKNWPIFLNIFADCMNNARFDEQHFTSEIKAILQEIALRKANPAAIIFDTMSTLLYPTMHPYHHTTIGYKHQLINSSVDNLKSFYKKYYTPANATLIIAGDIQQDDVFKKITELFNSLPQEPCLDFQPHIPLNEYLERKNTTIYLHSPSSTICHFWQVPAPQHHSFSSLKCLEYLAQEELIKNLIDKTNLAYSVQTHLYTKLLGNVFFIMIKPTKDTQEHHNRILLCINSILKKLTSPCEESIIRFQNYYTSSILKEFEWCRNTGHFINQFHYYYPTQSLLQHLESINELNTTTVGSVCKELLSPTFMHTISCLPVPEEESASWLSLQQCVDTYNQTLQKQKKERITPIEPPSFVFKTPKPELIDLSFKKPDLSFFLRNGLSVCVASNKQTPFIDIILQFKNQELFSLHRATLNQSYVQYFAMIMLEEVNGFENKYAFQEFCKNNGISYSFTKNNITFSCPQHLLQETLLTLVQLIQQASYPAAIFQQYLATYSQQLKNGQQQGSNKAHALLTDYLFKPYPWHKTHEQLLAELQCVQRDSLIAFKNNYIIPGLMQLIIVGNIEINSIQETLENSMNTWKEKNTLTKTSPITIPLLTNPRSITIKHQLPQQEISLAAGRITDYKNTQDILALELIETHLAKKLFNIREQSGLFYSSSAAFHNTSFFTKGYVSLHTTVAPHNLERTKEEIKKVLATIAQYGITQEELDSAKHNTILHIATSFESNRALASSYAYLLANNQNWNYFDSLIAVIKTINLNQVNATAKLYLNPETWTFVQVGRIDNHDT